MLLENWLLIACFGVIAISILLILLGVRILLHSPEEKSVGKNKTQGSNALAISIEAEKEIEGNFGLHWKPNANLAGAKLIGANFHSTNLRGAHLESADLTKADLHSAWLQRANLQSAQLQAADLHDADLQAANLYLTNLHSANLSYANMQFVNLSSANLFRANLLCTYLYGAMFDANTVLPDGTNWTRNTDMGRFGAIMKLK